MIDLPTDYVCYRTRIQNMPAELNADLDEALTQGWFEDVDELAMAWAFDRLPPPAYAYLWLFEVPSLGDFGTQDFVHSLTLEEAVLEVIYNHLYRLASDYLTNVT